MSPIPSVNEVIPRERYVPQEDDMRIKMDVSTQGSRDGSVTEWFMAGQEYDVPSSLGLVFTEQMGVAHKVGPPPVKEESASKLGPSETPGAGPSEHKEEEKVEWTLATPADQYLEKWPKGPKAELAKAWLAQNPQE